MTENEINEVENLEDASDFELKHYPTLTIQDSKAVVEVGKQVPHPQQEDHWIDGIALYLDGEMIEEIALSPSDRAVVEFDLSNKSGEVYVISDCNLHGLWKSHVETV